MQCKLFIDAWLHLAWNNESQIKPQLEYFGGCMQGYSACYFYNIRQTRCWGMCCSDLVPFLVSVYLFRMNFAGYLWTNNADCFDVAWLFADLLFCGLCSVCAGGSSQCICLNGTPNVGLEIWDFLFSSVRRLSQITSILPPLQPCLFQ